MAGSKDSLKDRLSRYRQIKISVVGSQAPRSSFFRSLALKVSV